MDFINHPVLLAPMAGVTDAAFRMLCRELGFSGLMFTEMVSAKALCYGDKKSLALAGVGAGEKPAAIQIFGSDPDTVARAVELLDEIGACQIDINMGCPMPKIIKNGDGAALLLDPARAAAVVRAAARSAKKPVSVKIRKGWDASHCNGGFDVAEFAKTLEDAGASMITVHGRTRVQMYGGTADWRAIAAVKRAVSIPVAGNGDVGCGADALKMMKETGCDGVMIGRAVRGNPWVLTEAEKAAQTAAHAGNALAAGAPGAGARDAGAGGAYIPDMDVPVSGAPAPSERIRVMKRHLDLAVQTRGERMGVLEARKHLAWYTKGFPGAAAVRNELLRLTGVDQIFTCIETLDKNI